MSAPLRPAVTPRPPAPSRDVLTYACGHQAPFAGGSPTLCAILCPACKAAAEEKRAARGGR